MKLTAIYDSAERTRVNTEYESWGVFSFKDDKGTIFPGVGVLRNNLSKPGVRLTLDGNWTYDKKYGRGQQFVFSNHVVCRPAGKEGILAVLKTLPGIGGVTALRLWDKWGDDAAKVLAEDPGCVEENKILSGEKLDKASQAIGKILIEVEYHYPLISILHGIGFPKRLVAQLLSQVWGDPVARIKENPFCLLEFFGVSFLRADRLRAKLKLSADMPQRLDAAVDHAIMECVSQVWIKRKKIETDVMNLLNWNHADVKVVVQNAINKRYVARFVDDGVEYLASRQYAEQEYRAAEYTVDLMSDKSTWPDVPLQSQNAEDGISDHQKEQLDIALANGSFAVLMGSAGSGKTFSAGQLVKAFQRVGKKVVVCAPTGKAALRVAQTLTTQGVRGISSTTIHRALGAMMDKNGFRFLKDGLNNRFIDADFVLVDEFSMVGNDLAYALFRAIRPGTQVLCIGDPHQLAPVSRGTLLRDWREWCHKTVNTYGLLTEIKRNEGMITTVCEQIYKGKAPVLIHNPKPGLDWDLQTNIQFCHCKDDEAIQTQLLRFYQHVLHKKVTIPVNGQRQPVHPVKGVQVIVAVNDNSPASRNDINALLQPLLNPRAKGEHAEFKIGDKIICIKNSWIENPKDRTAPKIRIANGSIGYVTKSFTKRIYVMMDDVPNMELLIPLGAGKGDFDLAYAITCHRMQGSQAPVVVTLLGGGYGASKVTDRGWFYTAITRPQHLDIILGTNKMITEMCKRTHINSRISFMGNWLERLSTSKVEKILLKNRSLIGNGSNENKTKGN